MGTTAHAHNDDECPNLETIKKMKGEIKRLRQEVLNGAGNKRGNKSSLIMEESEN
jgi:hypothetical protein